MPWYEILAWGCAGGVIPDVLRIIAARYDGPPTYLSSAFFWVSLVLLIIVGGATAWLVQPKDIVSALAVGFAAPEIISKLLGTQADRGADTPLIQSVRSWWAG
jgi:hypothetical protein